MKLELWIRKIDQNKLFMFPTVEETLEECTITPFSVNVYDVQELAEEEFIELSNSVVAKTDFVKTLN